MLKQIIIHIAKAKIEEGNFDFEAYIEDAEKISEITKDFKQIIDTTVVENDFNKYIFILGEVKNEI